MKKISNWYVVMNSHQARVLHDLHDSHDPEHREVDLGGPGRKLRDVHSDRPARSFASAGGGMRSAVEPGSDPLHEDALAFLREVFDYLEHNRVAGAFDGLVLIGAPDIVGLWREGLPATLRGSVRQEVVKNLVNLPDDKLIPAVRELTSSVSGHI